VYEDGEVQIREIFALRHHFKQEDLFDYGWCPSSSRGSTTRSSSKT